MKHLLILLVFVLLTSCSYTPMQSAEAKLTKKEYEELMSSSCAKVLIKDQEPVYIYVNDKFYRINNPGDSRAVGVLVGMFIGVIITLVSIIISINRKQQ